MALHEFLLSFAVILLAARLMAQLATRFGAPPVIGELLTGIIVGPSLLGWVGPDATLKLMAEVGIMLFLFKAGMETDLHRLARAGSKPLIVALVGVVAPMSLGFAVSFLMFGMTPLVSLFIGGTLTATSIGITVRVLEDIGRRYADEAQVVLGAAVLDDVLGVLVLAFLYQFASQKEVSYQALGEVALYIVLFMLLAPLAAKAVSMVIDSYDQRSQTPGLLLPLAMSMILFFSWLAYWVGAPEILGAFSAGLAMSPYFRFNLELGSRDGAHFVLRFEPNGRLIERLEERIQPLIQIFTPVFFVMVGVSLQLGQVDWTSSFVWGLSLTLLLAAVAGKFVAGFAIRERPLAQTAIGLAMIPRGEVGLIFAQLGLQQAILNGEIYTALILVIAATTLLPPFALKWFYGNYACSVPRFIAPPHGHS